MSKKIHHDPQKVNNMPKGSVFVQLSYELMNSVAWRSRSIHCIRLIEFLILENIRHKGNENGNLLATYDQLAAFGIGRRFISTAIMEAEYLGLILIKRGQQRGYAKSDCNIFTLTFLKSKQRNLVTGGNYFIEPSNQWRTVTPQDVKEHKQGARLYKIRRKEKIKNQRSKGEL